MKTGESFHHELLPIDHMAVLIILSIDHMVVFVLVFVFFKYVPTLSMEPHTGLELTMEIKILNRLNHPEAPPLVF